MKKLIPAICLLLISAMMLGTSTYAWFSMNRTVTATNMQVKAVASSSLAIAQALNVGTLTETAFTTDVTSLIPATRYDATKYSAGTTGSDTDSSGLIHVTNNGDVNASTGFAPTGKSLAYTYCQNEGDDVYYVDYVCYIASSGTALTAQDLNVKLFISKSQYDAMATNVTNDTTHAVSVDFYVNVNASTLGTYKGTLNLKTLTTADETPTTTSLYKTTSVELLSNGSIPKNGSATQYIQVTMRVYYDGALEKSSGQAYVYSDSIDTSNVVFGAEFTASDYVAPTNG